MIKVVTVIGARPQIIKAAAISRAIKNHFSNKINEIIVHTGQHYDSNMSQVFFDELNVPAEQYNLNVGSGSHAMQTAAMLIGIEEILLKEKPDCLLLYGDTNSTLAGAVAAAKIHLPVVHVEGGVRTKNKDYPEEVNRIICDHMSTLIFVPTISGVKNLQIEGFNLNNIGPYTYNNPKVFHCGDIMYDNSLYYADVASQKSDILQKNDLMGKDFVLVTMHRPHNVDDPDTLTSLLKTFSDLSKTEKRVFLIPLHPRTMRAIDTNVPAGVQDNIKSNEYLKIIPAVSFLDITCLEVKAQMIITDSGGVQKEAYYFKKPCIIMLVDTPWVELVDSGSAIQTGNDSDKIKTAYYTLMEKADQLKFPEIFGDGKASEFICKQIIETFEK